MKKTFTIFFSIVAMQIPNAQVVRDNRTIKKDPLPVKTIKIANQVILYEHAGFGGLSKAFGPGTYRLVGPSDLNDMVSSIKVPAGMAVVIYEHANEAGGYGVYGDLLEDCADLSVYNFNDKISYINVISTVREGYVWARARMINNSFVAGHWERKRANGALPDNAPPAILSSLQVTIPNTPSVLSVNGAVTTITTLGLQSQEGRMLWERAVNLQSGVIGNDYRGIEEIGSAAFERGSNNNFIPDNINFWYPQKQPNDHRSVVYFKRTLAGTVREARQANIAGTYQDYDVNIDIVPDPQCMYMITDGHRREYTGLMSVQWTGSAHSTGKESCDDPESIREFERVEAEIAEDYWPKGNHTYGRARLTDLALIQTGKKMCVYGPWIYDKGHCCHPEIHPAEQLWWSNPEGNGKKYNLNVLCDASRRFWWRHQMDDGTKLKPWGAPPIKGLFAIAFEYNLPRTDAAVDYSTKQFEVSNIKHYNVIEYPNADQAYNLLYQGKKLVTFIPHNNAFKVSFEHVGTVPNDPYKVRGFLVIETSVGVVTQIATSITVLEGNNARQVTLPANSVPEQVPEQYETRFFKKEEGHYLFTVIEKNISSGGSIRVTN